MTANRNSRIGIVAAIVVTAIFSSIVMFQGSTYHNDATNNANDLVVSIRSSYTATEPEDLKKDAEMIVKGEIVDKYTMIQSRDEFGNLVSNDSKKTVISEPYNVYVIKPTLQIKGDAGNEFKIKLKGGDLNGVKFQTGYNEYQVGDTVLVMIDKLFDGEFYQPIAGPYAIYKIANGKAIGHEKVLSEADLLVKLR
jgi:hypothetical protein